MTRAFIVCPVNSTHGWGIMTVHSDRSDTTREVLEVCPVSQAFEEIGSKWRLVVLHSIHMHGEQRFSELQETTSADSGTLSRVLAELEESGFVNRRLEDRPIATYYSLTEKGSSLAAVFDAIEAWADAWTDAESTAL